MRALDLFCGLGGWSDGLSLEGFEVLGVEILPKIAELYKHPVIVSDVYDLDPNDFKGYDLIVGSPPCRDFSSLGKVFGHRWRRPPDPEGEGMKLVNVFLRFIAMAKPKFWLMENVPGLEKYMASPPRCVSYIGASMRRAFWGNFPAFLVPRDYNKKRFYIQGKFSVHDNKTYPRKMAKWLMAKIPLPTSRALGRAVMSALSGEGDVDDH